MAKKKKDTNGKSGVNLLDKEKVRLEPPKKYNVVFYNDDYTPMDFVMAVLMKVFRHNVMTAYEIMMNVHETGKGIAGTYPKGIAETKVRKAMDMAKIAEFPLLCKTEET